MPFVHHHFAHVEPAPQDRVMVVQGSRLLARLAEPGGSVVFPRVSELAAWRTANLPMLHVGLLDRSTCWLCSVADEGTPAPDGWNWHETRTLLPAFTPAQVQAIGCARGLHWWQTRHRFCGSCGGPTVDAMQERAKHCPQCGATFFPAVTPAVIVAVTRGERLLLAHNRNHRAGLFSLLAGFVDPGETFEQATVREVREEAGIEIHNLRYVSSQPWPFPNSLMAGFRAEHHSGEIVVDGQEIEQADWYARDAMPEIPGKGTVARELIDSWLQEFPGA